MKFYYCEGCGKIAAIIRSSACPTKCCGEPMKEMVPGTSDGAKEKHVPVIKAEGLKVTVEVGSAAHPMTQEHFIEWIVLETKEGRQRKALKPGDAPKAVFALTEGDEAVSALAFCNLHGLWQAEI
ncbi:MAG: desulfoferrodoxin [Clostridia bacterium]|nr:desulfoferrodoxin [Clostridia bacterium]